MKKNPFYLIDPYLDRFSDKIGERYNKSIEKERELTNNGSLSGYASGHLYYGLHRIYDGWVFREWAPNATSIFLIGDFNNWEETDLFRMTRINPKGDWEILFSHGSIKHGDLFKLSIHWNGGSGQRLPSYANRLVQDDTTKIFSAQVWYPAPYKWINSDFYPQGDKLLIYEAHVGMATEDHRTGTYREFTENIIPHIREAGYNTIQLMAIQEHPFYGSFGYHVANYFAPSSRFGTPEELKELVDQAHGNDLRVIMDIVHSHSIQNINEGLGEFDGSGKGYFHEGSRRTHKAWDSLCFDYSKEKTLNFLLSNCRYWLEEFRFDGFRFDGITSMIYLDHGLERNFTDYDQYFNSEQDEDALTYLFLANKLIHEINPYAVTIAEEMSGYPGIAAPTRNLGVGFDYRMSMGVPDLWIKLIKEVEDEHWDIGNLYHELTQHRPEESTISYCESHDQALVGDQTLISRMLGAEIYSGMGKNYHSFVADRAIALHKMIRLITFATSGKGYLNFMGNEFGHPEWIDFPREGNNWSYQYARRQWSLGDNHDLKYFQLGIFDKKITSLQNEHRVLEDSGAHWIYDSDNDKIVAFTRGDLLFVFNFHPSLSFTDYGIPVHGKYRILFDTDMEEFGGYGRLDNNITYLSQRKSGHVTLNTPLKLYLYLPSRTAIVFKKELLQSALDI